jgi:uncharacterized protein with gpF-like domain
MPPRTRPPLRPINEALAKARRGEIVRGRPLVVPAVVQIKFAATLERMVLEMSHGVSGELHQLFQTQQAGALGLDAMDASFANMAAALLKKLSSKFTALFTGRAGGLAKAVAEGVNISSAQQLGSSLKEVSGGVTLKTDVISGPIADALTASIKQNVGLIKSIPAEYFQKIEGEVFRSIQTGRGMADLQPYLENLGQTTKKRADLIARDQTSKATTAINRARFQRLGIKKFEWLHSAGVHEPRPLHIHTVAEGGLNGGIFDIDNPPVIDERTGERGLPGQLINCSCRMAPVISFEAVEIK